LYFNLFIVFAVFYRFDAPPAHHTIGDSVSGYAKDDKNEMRGAI